MNCLLLGYGKMGKTLEKLLLEDGNKIIATIDNQNEIEEKSASFHNADIAFEFSTPLSAYKNIITCFNNNIPVVCGTTGWNDKDTMNKLKNYCLSNNQSLLYAPNFSIGINIILELNAHLSQILKKINMYDLSITETHHIHKKDKPSGTALKIKEVLTENINYIDIPIKSIREGEIVGIHTTTCKSDVDIIEISHRAISRDAFAIGAITAAKWLIGKKGFFNMQNVINF